MKKLKYILFGLVIAGSSCSKFDEINTNPEATKKVTSAMIATRIIINIANQPTQKGFLQPYMLNKNIVWTEFVESYQYNGFGSTGLSFTSINDAHFMAQFAGTEKLAKSYDGLMYFARAVKFFESTMDLGDIPYQDALKGETDKNYFPKYDTQKDVFIGVLAELERADQLFAEGEKFAGDPMYGGDPVKWRKLVNSFALHVLIQLSKKESDSDLQIKSKFQQILANKPIFTSNADNYQLIRSDKSGQIYPFYKVGNNFTIYPIMSTEIIDRLKTLQDRRLFYYAAPSPVKLEGGMSQQEFGAYVGIDPSLVYDNITAIKSTRDYSKLNDRYTEIATGEPTQQLSYSQLCFIVAEAATRGWIADPAVDWYKKGVEASMKFIYDNTPNAAQFHHDMPLDATYISTYVTGLGAAFPVAPEARIEAIITQKYLASFLQSEFYTYYDYRRTGYPKWKINSASSLNSEAPDRIPVRWKYPSSEFNYNTENVDAAVARQYDGVDDINKLMWILK
ncbi:SusD/RagB family nutrient-binding outer membrane lipoprotein [Sphingobacterium sp. SYP-B4668]|uniref:SusD/RagB family nutrient-binding outer membrane lipoprotein n=1 Tax=Sphingobacterium sp. SYP-B4668 TaxID=2996035 RepID=UPI0022DE800B|nr:SusD/RagB family nutrient-binding outer membrane lipoprotein [Sphingobacterium sp. SYP-B4668]